MNKFKQKLVTGVLLASLTVTPFANVSLAKTVKPKVKAKLVITEKANKKIQITGIKSSKIRKTTWITSSKKIRLNSKKKVSAVVRGVKKGTSTIKIRVILKNKKKYLLKCKVTVKKLTKGTTPTPKTTDKPVSSSTPTPSVSSSPTATPTVTATATTRPTVTPTTVPTATPTPYIPADLPEAEAVPVPEKPEVNQTYTNTQASGSKYDLTKALKAQSLKFAYSDYFSIGAAINGTKPSLSTAASPEMRLVMKKHFNSTTLSNLLKPEYMLDQENSEKNALDGKDDIPAVKYDSIVDNMEFCKDNGIKMRGHVLVWHAQTPEWFFKKGFKSDGDYVDKETMTKRLGSYIRQVMEFCQTYYPDVIYCWDVVNEAVEPAEEDGLRHSTWYQIFGGGDFIADAFYYARKYADSDVKLFYNDYNTFDDKKNKKIIEVIQPLKEAGLLDGVGMQSYLQNNYPGVESVRKAIENFAAADLEIQLTEVTYRVPNFQSPSNEDFVTQGQNYQDLMNMLIEEDTTSGGPANITNVTFFGLVDNPYSVFGVESKPDRDCWARLFDENFKLKPSYDGVMDALID